MWLCLLHVIQIISAKNNKQIINTKNLQLGIAIAVLKI